MNIMKICMEYRKIGVLGAEIMYFLDSTGGTFNGNFSDLTAKIGRKKAEVPNVTKSVKKLESNGLLNIFRDGRKISKIVMNDIWFIRIEKCGYND